MLVNLIYSFEVVGGTPGTAVPLLFATSLSTATTGAAPEAYASITISTSGSFVQQAVCTTARCSSNTFSGTIHVTETSDSVETVDLELEVGAGFSSTAQTGDASADPWIYVDPSFTGAADYSILVSPGVGNGLASVPEPSTLVLLCLTGPALFFARRWRRR